MAPEQLTGGEITPATDVYALGLILFELATGTAPFRAATTSEAVRMRLTQDAPRARSRRADVDAVLDGVIAKCLERDPARRFGSAAAIQLALVTPSRSDAIRSRLVWAAKSLRRQGLLFGAVLLVAVGLGWTLHRLTHGELTSNEIRSSIRRVSGTHPAVDRRLVQAVFDERVDLAHVATLIPEVEKGHVVGVRVFGVKREGLLDQLGFLDGDRIESVNGAAVTSRERAMEIFASLRRAQSVTVSLNRRGEPTSLEFSIQ
jgi:hypothetical protein